MAQAVDVGVARRPRGGGRVKWWTVVAALVVAAVLPVAAVLVVPARAFAATGDLSISSGGLGSYSDSPSGTWMVASGGGSWSSKLALLETGSNTWSSVTLPAAPSGGVNAVVDDSGAVVVAVFKASGGGSIQKAYRFSGGSWSAGVDIGLGTEPVAAVDASGSKVFVVGAYGTLVEASWAASSWSSRAMAFDSGYSTVNPDLSVAGGVAVFARAKSDATAFLVSRMDLATGSTSKAVLTFDSGGFTDPVVSTGPDGASVITAVYQGILVTWSWSSSGSQWDRRAELVPAEIESPAAAAMGSDGRLHLWERPGPGCSATWTG